MRLRVCIIILLRTSAIPMVPACRREEYELILKLSRFTSLFMKGKNGINESLNVRSNFKMWKASTDYYWEDKKTIENMIEW